MYNWSEFTDEEYPSTECKHQGLTATIKAVVPVPENGERNRYWTVKWQAHVIASGYTFGTNHARSVCEMVLNHEDEEFGIWFQQMRLKNVGSPRIA